MDSSAERSLRLECVRPGALETQGRRAAHQGTFGHSIDDLRLSLMVAVDYILRKRASMVGSSDLFRAGL